MKDSNFNELVESLVQRLLPRIPEEYQSGFEDLLVGGEYSLAVEDLVYLLADEEIPIDIDEYQVLRQLLPDPGVDRELLGLMEGIQPVQSSDKGSSKAEPRSALTELLELASPIDERFASKIQREIESGQYLGALSDITNILVDFQVPITPEMRETIQKLADALDSPIRRLHRLNVRSDL